MWASTSGEVVAFIGVSITAASVMSTRWSADSAMSNVMTSIMQIPHEKNTDPREKNGEAMSILTASVAAPERYDLAEGALFLADVGATGLPADRWRGSTTSPYWHHEKDADS